MSIMTYIIILNQMIFFKTTHKPVSSVMVNVNPGLFLSSWSHPPLQNYLCCNMPYTITIMNEKRLLSWCGWCSGQSSGPCVGKAVGADPGVPGVLGSIPAPLKCMCV